MNALQRTELLQTPRPVDADDVRIALVGRDWHCVWIAGKQATPFGRPFSHVSEAAAAARMVRDMLGFS